MKARVYDSSHDSYFKSEVYALINTGWYEKRLVVVPDEGGDYLKFFDFLDKNEKGNPKVLINTIVSEWPSKWINHRSGAVDKQLDDYRDILDKDIRFFEYIGFPWIFENKPVMIELLKGNSISVKGSIFENKIYTSQIEGWNYIETSSDVKFLMEQTSEFHDSVLKELNYVSGPMWIVIKACFLLVSALSL